MDRVSSLISDARGGDSISIGLLLQHYRNYLRVLASTQIDRRIQRRVSPSDVVQETMLRAHKHFRQFRGTTDKELAGWLRQILFHSLAKFVEQHVLASRRDVRREVTLDHLREPLEHSSIQLVELLPDLSKRPPVVVQEQEEASVLADRLQQLPEDYRDVLVLRNLQSLPFDEVAAHMGRSTGATRMLWLRAVEKLRAIYREENESQS